MSLVSWQLSKKPGIADNEGSGRYVLKPQRDGGGYSYYGDDLAKKIKENISTSTSEDENGNGALVLGEDLAEFILLQRLFPPKQEAVLLRAGLVEGTGESISELGCLGQSCKVMMRRRYLFTMNMMLFF